MSKRDIQTCICGRLDKGRKSFFSKLDIYIGIAVLGIIVIFLLTTGYTDILIVPFLLILAAFIPIFFTWLIKRHSLKCAIRWAMIVVFGSIGGFWLFSF